MKTPHFFREKVLYCGRSVCQSTHHRNMNNVLILYKATVRPARHAFLASAHIVKLWQKWQR
jgi:hypothetical protein